MSDPNAAHEQDEFYCLEVVRLPKDHEASEGPSFDAEKGTFVIVEQFDPGLGIWRSNDDPDPGRDVPARAQGQTDRAETNKPLAAEREKRHGRNRDPEWQVLSEAERGDATESERVVYNDGSVEWLLYDGARQREALSIVEEAARACNVNLWKYIDAVAFTLGTYSRFNLYQKGRVIALDAKTLNDNRIMQLITGAHEISHARHSYHFGYERYIKEYGKFRCRIEVLVEIRAIRAIERHIGSIPFHIRSESLYYIETYWAGAIRERLESERNKCRD